MPQHRAAAGTLSAALHLAVDARDLARDGRGIGTYARALLARFAQRSDVRLTLLVRAWFPRRLARSLREAIGAGDSAGIRVAERVPQTAHVVWHPWNGTFFAGGPAVPAVATLHDLVPFAFPAADARRRASQQEPFRRTARTAGAIVCDSAFTAGEAARRLGIERERLHVVPLGVDARFSPGTLEALPAAVRGRRYVLHVGAHDDHKNVATLVAAHRSAFAGTGVLLAFTRRDARYPDAAAFPDADQATLIALYRGALMVAVPSVYEGFGLPVLEAMACGAPVVVSRAASLPEVAGDAARYVDEPHDPAAWRAALATLAGDDAARTALAARGPLRASNFTWDSCAQRTLDVLRRTSGSR